MLCVPVDKKLTFGGINNNCIYLRIYSALVTFEYGRKPENELRDKMKP